MLLTTYNTSTSTMNLDITTPAQGLLLTMGFNAHLADYTDPADAIIPDVFADFYAAFAGGKVTIQYEASGASAQIPTTMVDNRPFLDVIQWFAGLKNAPPITIVKNLPSAPGDYGYTAYCTIPFSFSGTVNLSGTEKINVSFEGFTNPIVSGTTYTTSGAIQIDSIVVANTSNVLCKFSSLDINTTNTLAFPCGAATYIAVPSVLDKLDLVSSSVNRESLRNSTMRAYAAMSNNWTWNVLGTGVTMRDWFMVPCVINTQGSITLLSQGSAYLLTNFTV